MRKRGSVGARRRDETMQKGLLPPLSFSPPPQTTLVANSGLLPDAQTCVRPLIVHFAHLNPLFHRVGASARILIQLRGVDALDPHDITQFKLIQHLF